LLFSVFCTSLGTDEFAQVYQKADMTCAMDWTDHGDTFYDTWICRTMTGDMFIEIPQSGSFEFKGNLFWNDPVTRTRFDAKLPFQVKIFVPATLIATTD
jgi:alpha-1,3-mannosyltransferase